jgi:hypothetical protein
VLQAHYEQHETTVRARVIAADRDKTALPGKVQAVRVYECVLLLAHLTRHDTL